MLALLQCGHQTEATFGVSFGHCPRCGAQVAVQAVECRVWTVSCWHKYCRYRGIAAVGEDHARDLVQDHKAVKGHRSVTYDYIVPDNVKARVREAYGRGVKPFITGLEVEKRYPVTKPVVTVELPDTDGEVPF